MVQFGGIESEYHFYGTLVYVKSGSLWDGTHLMHMVGGTGSHHFFIPKYAKETKGVT